MAALVNQIFAPAATVDEVLPRLSELKDPAVANVDQVLLVFAFERPMLDLKGATRQVAPWLNDSAAAAAALAPGISAALRKHKIG